MGNVAAGILGKNLDQVNGEIIALLLPAHLAVAWAVVRVASSRQPIS